MAANGQTVTTRKLIARDGELRRDESQVASKTIAYLERPEGRFVLLPDEKIYAEVTQARTSRQTRMTTRWNVRPKVCCTLRQATRAIKSSARKRLADAAQTNTGWLLTLRAANVSVSETLIWIDEALRMPIKSETKSSEGRASRWSFRNFARG